MNILQGDSVAQLAHVGWGAALTFTLAHWLPLWQATTIVTAFAFTKEALEALGYAFWEDKQPWGSSLKDWAFFLVGIAWSAAVIR